MKKFTIIMIGVSAILLFTACPSPEKKGKELGEQCCDCQKKYVEAQDKIYQEFLDKFDSYGFKTRSEARQKWQNMKDDAKRESEQCVQEVEKKVKEARSKFPINADDLYDPSSLQKGMRDPKAFQKEVEKKTKEFAKNQEKLRNFEDSYRNAINQCSAGQTVLNEQVINEKILTIKPQKPDVANLKQNLVGRRILEQSGGYFGNRWAWQIGSSDEIKSIKIEKEEKVGEDYELDVHLVLQKEGASQYESDLILICVLGQEDDWKIDFIKTKNITILKTGRYDDCITKEIKKSYWSNNLQFTNSCDVNLIIGGQILENDNEWRKFSTNVNANSTGSTSYNGKDYKIDFIERQ
jgi:competence protein ComGC